METIFYHPHHPFHRGDKIVIASIAGEESGQYSAGSLNLLCTIAQTGAQLVVLKWQDVYDDLHELQPDGILLPGGSFKTDSQRAKAYLEAIRYAKEHALPTFGICAGMQMMAIAENAKLEFLSKPEEIHRQPGKHQAHTLYIDRNSVLSQCGYCDHNWVNSRHREVVIDRTLKREIRQLAWSRSANDEVVEALQFKWSEFAVGVQWHPEDLACINYELHADEYKLMAKQSQALFQVFVKAAKKYRSRCLL